MREDAHQYSACPYIKSVFDGQDVLDGIIRCRGYISRPSCEAGNSNKAPRDGLKAVFGPQTGNKCPLESQPHAGSWQACRDLWVPASTATRWKATIGHTPSQHPRTHFAPLRLSNFAPVLRWKASPTFGHGPNYHTDQTPS